MHAAEPLQPAAPMTVPGQPMMPPVVQPSDAGTPGRRSWPGLLNIRLLVLVVVLFGSLINGYVRHSGLLTIGPSSATPTQQTGTIPVSTPSDAVPAATFLPDITPDDWSQPLSMVRVSRTVRNGTMIIISPLDPSSSTSPGILFLYADHDGRGSQWEFTRTPSAGDTTPARTSGLLASTGSVSVGDGTTVTWKALPQIGRELVFTITRGDSKVIIDGTRVTTGNNNWKLPLNYAQANQLMTTIASSGRTSGT